MKKTELLDAFFVAIFTNTNCNERSSKININKEGERVQMMISSEQVKELLIHCHEFKSERPKSIHPTEVRN